MQLDDHCAPEQALTLGSACMMRTGVIVIIHEGMKSNSIDQNAAPAKYVVPRCYKVTGANGSATSDCRVGTGVNDVERKTIDERMKGNLVDQKGSPAKYVAPRCYKVTGAKKERPDVWVKDPTRSIVLQVRLLMTASAQILAVYTDFVRQPLHVSGFPAMRSRRCAKKEWPDVGGQGPHLLHVSLVTDLPQI